ncbi:MAG TPA: hypothetical protein VGF30_00435 [Bacteroidia bacterium]
MYQWFYNSLKSKQAVADDEVYLLNDDEVKYVKKRENITIFMAAFIGAAMVVLLYLPQYWWPSLFPVNVFHLPFLSEPVEFSVISFAYGMLLVFVEIVLLTFLNIYCTHHIAFSIGFITEESKHHKDKKDLLLSIGQEKKNKDIKKLGIDPHYGQKKSRVFLMNMLFTLKATLSNLLVKILIQRVLGRYAVREVMDMLGIPIFAFWNAWGTRAVLREARIIIMGQNYLDFFREQLKSFRELSQQEKILLYDTLQFVAMSKRGYHKNHFLLSRLIVEHFAITTEEQHAVSPDYYQQLNSGLPDFKQLNETVMLLGFVLDGSISYREKKKIRELKEHNVISKTEVEVVKLAERFIYGKGLL